MSCERLKYWSWLRSVLYLKYTSPNNWLERKGQKSIWQEKTEGQSDKREDQEAKRTKGHNESIVRHFGQCLRTKIIPSWPIIASLLVQAKAVQTKSIDKTPQVWSSSRKGTQTVGTFDTSALSCPLKAKHRQSQHLSRRVSRAQQHSFHTKTLTYDWNGEDFNETFVAEVTQQALSTPTTQVSDKLLLKFVSQL